MNTSNKQLVLNSLISTVGYVESQNQSEFMKGAEIALDEILKVVNTELERYSRALLREREAHEKTRQDITTLVEILRKYANEC